MGLCIESGLGRVGITLHRKPAQDQGHQEGSCQPIHPHDESPGPAIVSIGASEPSHPTKAHTSPTADARTVPASASTEGSFDVIVCTDVLEHMEHPDCVLRTQPGWLSSNGCAIVSLPNIVFLGIRLQLLLGRFNNRNVGALQRADLRFYALARAKELLQGAHYVVKGFEPAGWLSTSMPSW